MKQELEHKLKSNFPQIFVDLYRTAPEYCMAFGITCNDGWYDLIYSLCGKIMDTDPPDNFKVKQVKEKLGGLRFYAIAPSREIFDLIVEAEEKSYKVCERCGSQENVTSEGDWITTLCAECRESCEIA